LQSPDCYPEGLSLPGDLLGFCQMDHSTYRRSPFLDHRIERAGTDRYAMPFTLLGQINSSIPEQATHYIFHNAFCCSTLLTRYLEKLDVLLMLREPNILYEVLTLKRVEKTPMAMPLRGAAWHELYDVVCKLLARRYNSGIPTIIKPTDGCNFMMSALVARHTGNRALFLYSTLEHFMVSVLRYPPRHQWIRLRAQELLLDERKKGNVACPDLARLTVAQLAALVWSLHTGVFVDCASNAKQSFASLCADDLATNPMAAIVALCRHFALPVSDNAVHDVVAQMEVTRNAKSQHEYFDSFDRQAEYYAAHVKYERDIGNALSWIERLLPGRDLAAALPSPLYVE